VDLAIDKRNIAAYDRRVGGIVMRQSAEEHSMERRDWICEVGGGEEAGDWLDFWRENMDLGFVYPYILLIKE
jgi:hypothetical protein